MKLAVVCTHPIQYYAPWFRELARRHDLEVLYGFRQDARRQAEAGFGVPFEWDVPLLEGYPFRWLENVSRDPGVDRFGGCDCPEVRDLFARRRYDAVLLTGWNVKLFLQSLFAAKRVGTAAFSYGDSQLATRRARLWTVLKEMPYRWLLARYDAHLYVGIRNRAYLRRYGVHEERLFFAPRFVDGSFFRDGARRASEAGDERRLREELGIPPAAPVFLFVGKLIPKKRPLDLVDALARLPAGDERATHIVIVGDGPLRAALADRASSSADLARRVHLVGFKNQSELPLHYAAADALLLPSDGEETWGLVVNEAMACGLPAVVSDACGCGPDLIVDGSTGYVFPVGDSAALAARMEDLAKALAERRTAIRAAVSERIAAYTVEAAADGVDRAWSAVHERSPSRERDAENA